jgi:Holliday junction resolvase RusA-like endonuclease
MRVLAVDWSGRAKAAGQAIWLAEADRGQLVSLESGRTRDQLIEHLIKVARADDEFVVGLDFAFSFPRWWCEERSWSEIREVWAAMASEGEAVLASCSPPFWGRPGKGKPLHDGFRKTEREGSGSAKSVFQIGGAGAVGTGSIRGMPCLLALSEAGFSVWPFDPAGWPRVVEIYPRELTGDVTKSVEAERRAYLCHTFPDLDPQVLAMAAGSEDAFDAAVSALVMDLHRDELAALGQTSDPFGSIEGAIWRPIQTVAGDGQSDGQVEGRLTATPYCTLEVLGRPATFATAHEARWKEDVRAAVSTAGVSPRPDACFSVRIAFRTPEPKTLNERWDLDNLVKPTLDAMEGIFGLRAWAGVPQPNDDKVVHLDVSKCTVQPDESPGATIDVWLV